MKARISVVVFFASGLMACQSTIRASYGFNALGVGLVGEAGVDPAPSTVDCQGGTTGVCKVRVDGLDVFWTLGPRHLGLVLENVGDSPVDVVWDQSGFVEENENRPHGLVFARAPKVRIPSRFLPNVRSQLDLYPAGHVTVVTYVSRYGASHDEVFRRNIFRDQATWTSTFGDQEESVRNGFEMMMGRRFGVVLRVIRAGRVHDYLFAFEIDSVSLTHS